VEVSSVGTIEQRLFSAIRLITALMLIFTVVLVFGEVILRYVLNRSLGWAEELLRYLLIWMTFLGSYLAIKGNEHLSIGLFFQWLPRKWQPPIDAVANGLLLLFLGIFTVLSFQYTFKFFSDESTTLEIPMGAIYAILPIGGVLMFYQLLMNRLHRRR
jgi:TRAP-type C4-dicarboxylate transport system permease small subunit